MMSLAEEKDYFEQIFLYSLFIGNYMFLFQSYVRLNEYIERLFCECQCRRKTINMLYFNHSGILSKDNRTGISSLTTASFLGLS